ncbi:acyl carrier protein [Enterobacter bugandensis]|uniref:acyl carrier protein n=1 Tax=Enterobacter bugandensis TaxID=881260 RepID=UPI000668381D|nr:acyl carrier protein [Enterobacter bugandensis]
MLPSDDKYDGLQSRLTVQPPYYAFSRVYADAHSDGIYGDFIPEQPVDGEHGAISVAEAGRHVAILGTLLGESLTTSNDPGYYLAVEADVSGAGESVRHAQPGEEMTAYVRRRKSTANRLTVDGKLLYKNSLLFTFVVSYVRLGAIQFRFLYRDVVMPTFTVALPIDSPWRQPVPLRILQEIHQGKLSAEINSHNPILCAGHFENYPMWPVAIVMTAATQLISTLLRQTYYSELQYRIISANMRAKKLLSVSKSIIFHAEILNYQAGCVNVRCLISSNGDMPDDVAELMVKLTIHDSKESAMDNFDDEFFVFLSKINPEISAADKENRAALISAFWQDSVDALTVLTEIEKEYGVRVPDSDFADMDKMPLQRLCDIVRSMTSGTA